MALSLRRATPPAAEPLTLDELKNHLRVDFDDDDALIASLGVAARSKCEDHIARSFITTGWVLTLDRFPLPQINSATGQASLGWSQLNWSPERIYPSTSEPIRIPRADLVAVSSLTYVDPNGTTQTLDPSQYQVQAGAPGMVYPARGLTWPASSVQSASVQVSFTAGYGTDPSAVPDTVKAVIKLLTALMYERREEIGELPAFLQWMLAGEDWGIYS
jgi:uncharacterized phiE125 gp8 family phage protein